jgi:transcriptional regulator with XRE-family HTH domain
LARLTLSNLGAKLREMRGGKALREVATEIGTSPATLSRVENGKVPDIDTFSKICRWMKISPNEVLGCSETDKVSSLASHDKIVSVHFRAERIQNPELSQALAELIMKAHDMLVSDNKYGRSG